jgi:SAM-dependent methyltransferase
MNDEYEAIAELYDHVVLYRDRPDIAFYVDAARNAHGPVLEIGCGTGRILIPAARAGVEIVGLDASPHMLAVCRHRLRAETAAVQSSVQLVQADMRSFDLDKSFSLAMIPFRPFQHLLTVPDQLQCLATVRRHIADGGRLVFDVFNPSLEALASSNEGQVVGEEPEFTTPDGRRVVRSHKIVAKDRFNQVNQIELIYEVTHPDGRAARRIHAFSMRYFFRYEMEHLLARSGFEVEHLYADYDKSPYGSRYPGDLIFVARKRA